MKVAVKYDAPPTLGEFQEDDSFVRCIVGPVGSGKSSVCVLELLLRAAEQAPGPDGIRRSRWAVIRNTYPQLRDTSRKTFEAWIPHQLGQWKEQEFCFHLRFGDVDAEILFRALDRPEDVKKLLSLELTGAYINEVREIPKHVFDVLQTRVGRYPSKLQGGPSWFGIWMDTNPWHSTHWGRKLFSASPDGFKLWHQPGGRTPQAENVENLPPGYYPRLCQGKDEGWIRVYVDGQEATSDEGSIYGAMLDKVGERGGMKDFEHPADGVFTSWDLGLSDSTAIWFWRIKDNGVDFIGHYRAHGQPLSHYFDLLEGTSEALGWMYVKHWLPHDAAQRTLASQVSVLDQFTAKLGADKVAIGPSLTLMDGIQASRWVLEQPGTRFHPRCEEGLEDLREYRYAWDEEAQTFSRKPIHNFASHTADAFRYASCVAKVSGILTRKVERPKPPPIVVKMPTLNELWDGRKARPRSRI